MRHSISVISLILTSLLYSKEGIQSDLSGDLAHLPGKHMAIQKEKCFSLAEGILKLLCSSALLPNSRKLVTQEQFSNSEISVYIFPKQSTLEKQGKRKREFHFYKAKKIYII